MNTTYRGFAASANRSFHPVYEDFRPLMEPKEDPRAKTVHIHLPGFQKEQVRVVAESSRRILRVHGERQIGRNKWIRFLEEVTVPENCEMAGTTAKFEGGFLRISMPIKMHPKPQFAPETLEEEEAESGKMLMNVGVAAVVIVALGSWISYSSIAGSSASSII